MDRLGRRRTPNTKKPHKKEQRQNTTHDKRGLVVEKPVADLLGLRHVHVAGRLRFRWVTVYVARAVRVEAPRVAEQRLPSRLNVKRSNTHTANTCTRARTHTHPYTNTHLDTHRHLRVGGLKKNVFEKRQVFKEDLKELTEDV